MILRFTAPGIVNYLSFNTENKKFTMSGRITAEYDKMRHFIPHVIHLEYEGDLWDMKEELEHNGYTETDESYIFYDGNDTCTEFVTDDLPFC